MEARWAVGLALFCPVPNLSRTQHLLRYYGWALIRNTSSKLYSLEMHEKFLISFGAENRGGCYTEYAEIEAVKCLCKVFDNSFVEGWITNDATFAHHSFAHLKLRLDKTDEVALGGQERHNNGDQNL